MACAVGDNCERPVVGLVPGFVLTAVQPVRIFVPGCSGNVVPGLPASANAAGARIKSAAIDSSKANSFLIGFPFHVAIRTREHIPRQPGRGVQDWLRCLEGR